MTTGPDCQPRAENGLLHLGAILGKHVPKFSPSTILENLCSKWVLFVLYVDDANGPGCSRYLNTHAGKHGSPQGFPARPRHMISGPHSMQSVAA